VTRALVEREVEVRHLRGNGQVVAEADLGHGGGQDALFG